MQTTSPRPVLPATAADRIIRRLDPAIADDIPRAVLEQPLGGGTVASQLERSVRVRIDGTAEPSQRSFVPETRAAVELLRSPVGQRFEQALRSALSVADGHRGADDLKTITLHPDEASGAASSVLDEIDLTLRDGDDLQQLESPRRASRFVKEATQDHDAQLSFRAAVNTWGHVSVAPDVSRELLASLGMYRPKPGDGVLDVDREDRADVLQEAWNTLVHEVHHSVTPEPRFDDEPTNVLEEAIPSVLEREQGPTVAARAGVDMESVASRLGEAGVDDAVGALAWPPWNRDHLPEPDKELQQTADARYVDGPDLVSGLLELAGIDPATSLGIVDADDLLQGERAMLAPARIAEAIATKHRLTEHVTGRIVDLIRDATSGDATLRDIEALLER